MKAYFDFKSGNGVTKINLYLTEEDIEVLKSIKQTVKMVETSKHGVTVFSDKPVNDNLLPLLDAILVETDKCT